MSRAEPPIDLGERVALRGLDEIGTAQLRRCVRTLLRRPLLRADGPDGDVLATVRRHADRLQTLFQSYLGYRLVVEPTFARLYKTDPPTGGTRGAHKPNGTPFTPRGYAYLALVLAVLTGGGGQLLLSGLVADVRAAAAEAGLELGTGIVDRRALAAALRHLIDLGVLTETDGSVAPWAEDAGREALLTVDVELLRHLVAAPLSRVVAPGEPVAGNEAGMDSSPSGCGAGSAPSGCGAGSAPSGRGAGEVHRLRRRLVEDPVVHRSDLSPAQRAWLRQNLRREAELLEDVTGLRLEARAEGVLAVDPDGYLTDLAFPAAGSTARVALLALAELTVADAEDARDGDRHDGGRPSGGAPGDEDPAPGWRVVSAERFAAAVAGLVDRYPRAWSREAVRDADRLTQAVARTLIQAGLARALPGGAVALSPAAARYRPLPDGPEGEPEPSPAGQPAEPPEGQESLFAVDGPRSTGR
ncbi:TIGR02678 family protein [Marinactinospora rubrisoli]|uniref:TIGR02678 family protein n=1 Tax=Marinactinospora rubrisoli TaxID=2715399 RepID=A0ABW2KN17_9ACTN